MSMPPAIVDLHITTSENRPIHLWLPLFLLWPLALALGAIALVFTVLVDVVLLLLGQRYHHYTMLLVRSIVAFNQVRGTVIRVKDSHATFAMKVM